MKRKDKLGEIRSRLNIDDLDLETRRQLFKDFQKIGGRVVSVNRAQENKQSVEANVAENTTEKGAKLSKNAMPGDHNIKSVKTENPFDEQIDPVQYMQNRSSNKKKKMLEKAKKTSFMRVFFSQLRCYFAVIFDITASRFSKNFIKLLSKESYDQLTELKFALDPIFKKTTQEMLEFRKIIYNMDLLEDYEMAYHIYQIVDDIVIMLLKAPIQESVVRGETQIKKLYATLHQFHQYSGYTNVSTSNIVILFGEKFPHLAYQKVGRATMTTIFYSLWNVLYFKLDILINYYWFLYNRLNSYKSITEYLGLDEKFLEIGIMAEAWKNQYIIEENSSEEKSDEGSATEESAGKVFPSASIERGVHFIFHNVNFVESYMKFREGQDTRRLFTLDDCLFYTYVLVDFFDSQFSFLWTGDIVNYYVVFDFITNIRLDVKKDMQSQHNKISHFYELVNEYLRIVKSANALKKSSGMKLNEDKRETDISRSSFSARQALITTYEKYKDLLAKIMASKSTSDPIVSNLDELISTHKEKCLNGETIEKGIEIAQDYLDAVIWLIKFSDLSGLHYKLKNPRIFRSLFEDIENILDNQDQK